MKSPEEKYLNVIKNNTFYYYDEEFESEYEKHIFSVREAIIYLRNEVANRGCKKEVFEDFLGSKRDLGLKALLAVTGFSNEGFKRLITVVRIVDDQEVSRLVYKEKWAGTKTVLQEETPEVTEWGTEKIEALVRDNEHFRKGVVNIFYDGSGVEFFRKVLPTFEFQKFSLEKLRFDMSAIMDTLARYKEKGSRSAKKMNNPESLVHEILDRHNISYDRGDLAELITNANITKRSMDFIIPDKKNPRIIAESSFLVTTASGQGDKSKTEVGVSGLIKQHYPNATFIGFVDGIGWYVRKRDLKRMVQAYEDVFTYHSDELQRFEKLLIDTFLKDA
jgi:hypothetical protein